MSRLLPRLAICADTDCVVPLPSVTIVTTAETPMTTPRMVRVDRMTLRRRLLSAIRIVVMTISAPAPSRVSRAT